MTKQEAIEILEQEREKMRIAITFSDHQEKSLLDIVEALDIAIYELKRYEE